MDILKFITAGSVDDGKSTLIGRLLYDSKSIMTDHLDTLVKQSKNREQGEIDLALLTDGLRAEREQGITIDVAYRYFNTVKRKFIIADAPGHVQYTRNMITGASNVSLIIILIDARNGIIEQTRRHSIIASLLKIPKVVVAINKMDITGFSEAVFDSIKNEYKSIADRLNLGDVTYIPISALLGDNIVEPSRKMTWYKEKPLLQYLEEVEVAEESNQKLNRFQVQYVIRPQTENLHDYRGYAGQVRSGNYATGDTVMILPSGKKSKIKYLETGGTAVDKVQAPQSIVMQLEDDIDISRGDSIVLEEDQPVVATEVDVILCWMDEQPLESGKKYILQHHQQLVRCVVKSMAYKIDVNSLTHEEVTGPVHLNEIVRAKLKLASPIVYDSYSVLRSTGSAILIDETGNQTAGAVLLQV